MYRKGMMGVDWEARVDFDRLRKSRLEKAKAQLNKSGLGALVLFRPENIRYVTASWSGSWTGHVMPYSYAVLPKDQDPILYSGALERSWHYHSDAMPWLGNRVRLQKTWYRGAFGRSATSEFSGGWALDLKKTLEDNGIHKMGVGFDILDTTMLKALNEVEIDIDDAQLPMWETRMTKTEDEIEILRQACTMATAAFWRVREELRPGIRECELKAVAAETLFSLGSEEIIDITCCSGPHTNPNFAKHSDRIIDYGELVFLDIMHRHLGYCTCYYRTFVCGGEPNAEQRSLFKECRKYLYDVLAIIKPGVKTTDLVAVWPAHQDLGMTPEQAAGRYLSHGIGLSHHELPFSYPGRSENYPVALEKNMVLAVETYAGDIEGKEGVRLEDDVLITKDGIEILTKYPNDELTG